MDFMRHGVANHGYPGATTIHVLPVFGMLAGGIVAGVDIVVPLIHRAIVGGSLHAGITAVGKLVFIAHPAPGAFDS